MSTAIINAAGLSAHEASATSALSHIPITIDSLREAPEIVSQLTHLVQQRRRYKHEVKGEEDVEFYMVGENATIVEQRLDQVLG